MNKQNNGCIYTKKWVVDMMLDLVGYVSTKRLDRIKIVEPACGEGGFTSAIVERLLKSLQDNGIKNASLEDCCRFYETDAEAIEIAKSLTVSQLLEGGYSEDDAESIVNAWYVLGDFIDSDVRDADLVVGNPPYIRAADIPLEKRKQYKEKLENFTLGADLYIAFFEHGLRMLNQTGKLAFICSDRWQKNQYGKKLRSWIRSQFFISYNIAMHDVDAFEKKVTAYPAITVIQKREVPCVEISCQNQFDPQNADKLYQIQQCRIPENNVYFYVQNTKKNEYENLPTLLEAGVNMGIGVATGKDSVFVVNEKIDIEEDRLLPLAYSKDITKHHFSNEGKRWLINPWNEAKQLIKLEDYPKLTAYLLKNRDALAERHIAKKNEANWYRTIDKVDMSLVGKRKLLIRDIGNQTEPILDYGHLYPHHNLYWITSNVWDLEVLGGILISQVVKNMMLEMSVSMRGGMIRNQVQYLKRIKVPAYDSLEKVEKEGLREAFRTWNIKQSTEIAERIYKRNG